MVLDFIKFNEKTFEDSYPLANINDILDSLRSARYFSVFDLANGFHHIKMVTKDSYKTAFSTPHGDYEFDRMPFGLKTAPATFQRSMDTTLTGLIGTKLFVYLDDIVIFADTLEEHEKKFNNLIQRLRKENLHLQPNKGEFFFLNKLVKKDTPFLWTDKQQTAFDIFKSKLCEEPLLQRPDFSQPFVLITDASGYAIGGILSQGKIGKDKPIAYASRSLSDTEKKYDTYETESLAIIFCVTHFRPNIYMEENLP